MKRRGQVWVETIIYTLIAFVMIGLILYFANPKIREAQDRSILEQSAGILENLKSVILNIGIPGNKRLIEITVKKGELIIDGVNDKLIFQMDSEYIYSEPGKSISYGTLDVSTQKKGDYSTIILSGNYSDGYNITYEGSDQLKTISQSSSPYKLFISNSGGSPTNINFELG